MGDALAIWREQTSVEKLSLHFEDAVARSKKPGRDGVSPALFRAQMDANLLLVSDRLRAFNYRFSTYGQKLITRGSKRLPREISVPTVRDRVALRAMAVVLNTLDPKLRIELPQSKVARLIAALEAGAERYVQLDIRDFYPSIDHRFLADRLTALMGEQMASVFMAASGTPTAGIAYRPGEATESRGVPQGLAISNGLAELIMRDVDRSSEGGAYFRYVDDIVLLGTSEELPARAAMVRRALKTAGLSAHDDSSSKSGSGTPQSGFEYLGYRFEWPRITVRAESVRRIETTLARSFTAYKYAVRTSSSERERALATERLIWHANLVVSGFTLQGTRRGWVHYYSLIRDQHVLRHLDDMVAKFAQRFGLDPSLFKSFRRAYRFAASSKADTSGYVPNFDLFERNEKTELLVRVFGEDRDEVDALTDAALNISVERKLERVAAELDRDVARGY